MLPQKLIDDLGKHVESAYASGTVAGYDSCLARMWKWHEANSELHWLSLPGIVQYLIHLRQKNNGISSCAEAIAAHAFGRKLLAIPPCNCAWLYEALRLPFKKGGAERPCPSLDAVTHSGCRCLKTDARLVWCFCCAAAFCLRAQEFRLLTPSMLHPVYDDAGTLRNWEIHFPRHATKRDSWLRELPPHANDWVEAFSQLAVGEHPLLGHSHDYYRRTIQRVLACPTASARHVGASYCNSIGMAVSDISRALGHTAATVTEIYVHPGWMNNTTFSELLTWASQLNEWARGLHPAPPGPTSSALLPTGSSGLPRGSLSFQLPSASLPESCAPQPTTIWD
jgi:hypothetical protein